MTTREVVLGALLLAGTVFAENASASDATDASATESRSHMSAGIIALISIVGAAFILVSVTLYMLWARRRVDRRIERLKASKISRPIPLQSEEKFSFHTRTASSFSASGSCPGTTFPASPSIPSLLTAAELPSGTTSKQPSLLSRSPSGFSRNSIRTSQLFRSSYSNPNLGYSGHGQGFYTTRSSRGTQSTTTFRSFTTGSEFDYIQHYSRPRLSSQPSLPSLPSSPPPPRPPRSDAASGVLPSVLYADFDPARDHHMTADEFGMSVDHSVSHHSHSHSNSGSISSLLSPSLASHPFNRTDSGQYSASGEPAFSSGSPTSSNDHATIGSPLMNALHIAASSPLRPPPRPRPNHPRV